jgi:predicted secreted protein
MALPGKLGKVLIQTEDAAVAFANEATTASTDFKRYTVTDSDKCYWDKNTAPTVKKNGSTVTTGYSIEYPGGVIVFSSAYLETDVITVSGKYIIVEQVAGFFSWSLKVNGTTIDVTDFDSDEWGSFIDGTKSWTVDAEKFWVTSDAWSDRIDQELILILYCDFGTAKTRFEGYAIIASDEVDTAVSDAIKNKISFSGSQGIYFRTN